MSNFNFTSQVCTSREQSERLLALGLKKETADCFLEYVGRDNYGNNVWHPSIIVDNYRMPDYSRDFPAWSLHRLIELCGIDRLPICFGKKGRVRIRVSHIHPTHDGRSGYNHYDSLIDCIEWLIGEGYFNKEYLEEK